MKKLIAFAVGLALVSGGLFAVDVGGAVIGTVQVVGGDTSKELDKDDPYSVPGSSIYDVYKAKEKGKGLFSNGKFNRLRFEGSGDLEDGLFGGFIRLEIQHWAPDVGHFEGFAWWKPVDALKLTIGSFGDGFWGKDGVTRWGFYQTATDTDITDNGNYAWGGAFPTGVFPGVNFSDAFFGGYGAGGLFLEIKPVDMFGINLGIPFFSGGKTIDVLKKTVAQVDVNLDFGNIALTFAGNSNEYAGAGSSISSEGWDMRAEYPTGGPLSERPGHMNAPSLYDDTYRVLGMGDTFKGTPSRLYLYFGLSAIENISIDVGVGYPLAVKDTYYNTYLNAATNVNYTSTSTYQAPIAAGVGAKIGLGDFGIKARVLAEFGGSVKTDHNRPAPPPGYVWIEQDPYKIPLFLGFEVMPYIGLSDTMRVFFALGLSYMGASEYVFKYSSVLGRNPTDIYKTDSVVGWHINPYIEIGGEWGPKFLAGIKIWSDGGKEESPLYKATRTYNDGDPLKPYLGTNKAIVKWAVPIALMASF